MELSPAQQLQLFRSSRLLLESLSSGKGPRAKSDAWKSFSSELAESGLPRGMVLGAVAAVKARLGRAKEGGKVPPIRQLHQMEREIVSTEAWGLLLESVRLGLIEGRQTDDILEQTAQRSALPVQKTGLEQSLAKNWSRILNAEANGLLPS